MMKHRDIQMEMLKQGDETNYPIKGSRVQVHCESYFHDGKKFDSTRENGEPFEFVVDKGDVIPGWDLALLKMSLGEKSRVVCPPNMAYGAKGFLGIVPPNALLIFEIELITIK